MKALILILMTLLSGSSFADTTTGAATVNNDLNPALALVSIKGDAAKTLYDLLNSAPTEAYGVLTKNGKNFSCYTTVKTGEILCQFFAKPNGSSSSNP